MKKYLLFFMLGSLFFFGCSDEKSSERKIRIMNSDKVKANVNPSSMALLAQQQNQAHKDKVELSKIEANTKIELEKIRSTNELSIAKINAEAKKEMVRQESKAKIETSQMEVAVKKESVRYGVYVAIAVILLLMLGLYLLYLNAKKNRELKKQLHEEKLKHEQFLKEKELEEQRLHKLMELAADGKLPQNIESEVILTISNPKKTIEHSQK
jgi:hypothetical protein